MMSSKIHKRKNSPLWPVTASLAMLSQPCTSADHAAVPEPQNHLFVASLSRAMNIPSIHMGMRRKASPPITNHGASF